MGGQSKHSAAIFHDASNVVGEDMADDVKELLWNDPVEKARLKAMNFYRQKAVNEAMGDIKKQIESVKKEMTCGFDSLRSEIEEGKKSTQKQINDLQHQMKQMQLGHGTLKLAFSRANPSKHRQDIIERRSKESVLQKIDKFVKDAKDI